MQKAAAYTTKNWVYFLLIVLAFVLYGNTIQNDYGLDDTYVVTDNAYVQKGIAGIPDIASKPYATVRGVNLDNRPFVLMSFAIEHQFFGNNPHVSHFINILLYALSLVALYIVLIQIFRLDEFNVFLPIVITVLFAVHPLHTEVVASLKNRDELMVLLFGLLFLLYAYYFYTKENKRWLYALLSILFLVLALFSKITGIIFVGIFILIFIYYSLFKHKIPNYVFLFFVFFWVSRALQRVFLNINRKTNFYENPLEESKNILINIGTASKILLYHVKMLLIPAPLRFYYGFNMFPLVSLSNPVALISLMLHAVVLFYGIWKFFKKDILGLFILCYFVSIFLYANFPIPYTSMFSERALLLSSLWFIIILAVIIFRLFKIKKPVFQNTTLRKSLSFLLLGLFVVYSFMTISRNFLWKTNLTLMEHDINYMENSVLGNYIYANNLKYESKNSEDKQQREELANKALLYYQRTINLAPTDPEFYFKMASTYRYNLNNLDSAETHFGYAISIDSLYGDANYELAKLFFDKRDFQKSYYYFGRTYNIQPKDSLTLFYYAQSAEKVNDMITCYKINQQLMNLYPQLPYSYLNLGVYYSKQLKDDTAVIYLEKAIERGAREPGLLKQMSVYFANKKDDTKSKYYLDLLNNR